ncbi:unnamed protein product [Cylicocyclus nassatus]|uniref:EB domain-containing protein n=1 Tax=Cylicocyclus nassatus TaxID=53992 RepID=A0AA36M6P9_CYLNA|nr:unnamed protein product [Cylicocyclus nassatus]
MFYAMDKNKELFEDLVETFFTVVSGQCPPGLYPFPSSYQPSTCSPQDVCACQNLKPGAACQYSAQHMRAVVAATYWFQNSTNRCECPDGTAFMNGECVQTGSGCELGMVMVNGTCESLASPGMQCMVEEQCIDHSQCVNNSCQCIQGFQLVNGYCVPNNGGRCPVTQVLLNGKCVQKVPIGSPCQVTQQCLGGAQCNYGLCQCAAGQSIINGVCSGGPGTGCPLNQVMVNGQCMPTVGIGLRCSYTQQCLGNSVCVSNLCQCPTGSNNYNGKCTSPECQQNQILVNNQCLPLAVVGGRCTYNEQCTGNSECANGYCRCPDGSAPTNGICNGQGSVCKTYQVSVNNQCLDKVSIGQSCTNTAQCIANARCTSVCECNYPSVYDGTSCVTGITYCSPGTVSVTGRCFPLVRLGQSCQNSAQCMSFGTCSNGVCVCQVNAIVINNVCRTNEEIGGSCLANQQCQGGSVCQSGYCRCPSGQVDFGDGICRYGSSTSEQVCASPNEEVVSTSTSCQYSSCPFGSYCYLNPQRQQYYCCRQKQSSAGGCANPSQTIKYTNGAAINCLYARCPSGNHCEYSNALQQYVCCG